MNPSQTSFLAFRVIGGTLLSLSAAAVACKAPKPESGPRAPSQTSTDSTLGTLLRTLAQAEQRKFEPLVPDSVVRQAVKTYFPTAITGGQGPHPFLWFLVDSKGRVLRTATGRDGLSRWTYSYLRDSVPGFFANMNADQRAEVEANGLEYLDAASARRKFPELLQTSAGDSSFSSSILPLRGTPIRVAWVQLVSGTELR